VKAVRRRLGEGGHSATLEACTMSICCRANRIHRSIMSVSPQTSKHAWPVTTQDKTNPRLLIDHGVSPHTSLFPINIKRANLRNI